MNALKPGDRVHIEFEADVVLADADGVKVYHDGADWRVPTEFCKVIVPPVALGDIVTADNIGQLPSGSVIAHPLSPAWTLDQGWWTRFAAPRSPGHDFCSGGYVVLRIGGGDQ